MKLPTIAPSTPSAAAAIVGLGTGMASIIRRACRARPAPSSRCARPDPGERCRRQRSSV
ncbi:hypothetical protein QP185_15100 [Sphingomonas aerolata]|uniref:hypothetical protein n=1 Tax=Sphingomonas aerolata TaxID=185951 RepID=UPI002FE1DF70